MRKQEEEFPKHPTPFLNTFTEPGGQFNDTEVGRRRGKTLREVLGELNDAQRPGCRVSRPADQRGDRTVGSDR
jgi:hypothetical protein